jgi:AraC-like DNA-binding protein
MLISDTQFPLPGIFRQSVNESELLTSLKLSGETIELDNAMLFARPLNENAEMAFTAAADEEGSASGESHIRQTIVLSTLDKIEACFSGEWAVEILAMSQVTTLFSFLDFQAKHRCTLSSRSENTNRPAAIMQTERNFALTIEQETKTFMAMIISAALNPQDRRLECLFSFVRNVESYWIAHFLLSQVMNEDKESDTHKICNASKIYGVSESYFRKLCHHAFTRGPKKQLRLWRAAHSALQLIEKDNSIATIAGNNGYASSSHFSSEIKSLFGITPREFKKLEGLLHE